MVRLCRYILTLLLLLAGGETLFAAVPGENRAFDAAVRKFSNGFHDLAEKDFAEFAQTFPESARLPEAVLYQARANFALRQFDRVIELLSERREKSGRFADQYLYWIGKARFEQENYETAAATFAELVRQHTNSTLNLDASIRAGTALVRLQEWERALVLLQDENGVFQKAVRAGATNEMIAAGLLLLGEAQLGMGRSADVRETLNSLAGQTLDAELNWRRQFLQTRWQLAEGRLAEARPGVTNLVSSLNATNRAQGRALEAEILERMNNPDEAVAAYEKNLVGNVPVAHQRRALTKIAELRLAQNKTPEAVQALERFLAQFPRNDAADLALLTLGELQLKQAVTHSTPERDLVSTNFLRAALGHFDNLLTNHAESVYAPRAALGKGWCLWLGGRVAESAEAFRQAAETLEAPAAQAEARFKWADAQFQMQDFAGAISNYLFLAENFASVPAVKERFIENALYQTVRVALQANDLDSATNALHRILEWYPDGFAGDRALLFTGDKLSERDPARARELLGEFEQRFPDSPLVPEVRLAIARSFEKENQWEQAITRYDAWIATYTNQPNLLPRAEFCRAWGHFMAGNETNALTLFTNFVARFPANRLAPLANWWIGDHYFNQGDNLNAESWYQLVFATNAPPSPLVYEARMMAGRAAVARQGFKDAITYFTSLATDLTCPLDLRLQAQYAYGDALMHLVNETNKLANVAAAVEIFRRITQDHPANDLAPLAWGRIGDCYLLLGDAEPQRYQDAAEAYQQVLSFPQAGIAAREQARLGRALVLEKQASQKTGPDQEALLKQALNIYLDVLYGKHLREGEQRNLFWTRKAGLEAGRLAETLQAWPQAISVYRQLQDLLPPLRPALEKRILRAQEQLSAGKS